MQRWWAILSLVVAGPAWGDVPDSAAQLKARSAELQKQCDLPDAAGCLELGSLAESDYTVMATQFHHEPDLVTARRVYRRALELLEPSCKKGNGEACNEIARVYFGDALPDRARRLVYLERGCAAKDATSCLDRGQASGRSKRATVPWYAEACKLGEQFSCEGLSMLVLASVVLDPAERSPMDGAKLRAVLETAVAADARPQLLQEQALALAVARLWARDRKAALAELAAAKPTLSADPRLHIVAAYAELVAADGFDRARARQAWQRLTELVTMHDGKYEDQELESDYAWADPTQAMERARKIAARNR